MMSSVDHSISWRQGDGFLSVPHPNLFIKPIPVRLLNVLTVVVVLTVDPSVRDAHRILWRSPYTLAVWGR